MPNLLRLFVIEQFITQIAKCIHTFFKTYKMIDGKSKEGNRNDIGKIIYLKKY